MPETDNRIRDDADVRVKRLLALRDELVALCRELTEDDFEVQLVVVGSSKEPPILDVYVTRTYLGT